MRQFPLSLDMILEIHMKVMLLCQFFMNPQFKMDPQRNPHIQAYRTFLEYVDDKFLRYDLAKDLGLEDLMHEIANTTPGLKEFKLGRKTIT